MKCYYFFCALGMLGLAATQSEAQTLYGATSSGHGELYTLNPATGGVLQDIGPLNDAGAVNYSVTGLAFNPITGVLFGSTGGVSGHNLLMINPANGVVTVVGSFNAGTATMTDLAFDSSGNLYGISSSGGANLYSIDPATGNVTDIGPSVTHLDAIAFSVPEPGAMALFSAGSLMALIAARRKKTAVEAMRTCH